jgi:hypothetical protein
VKLDLSPTTLTTPFFGDNNEKRERTYRFVFTAGGVHCPLVIASSGQ